jgi:hypothetical protein
MSSGIWVPRVIGLGAYMAAGWALLSQPPTIGRMLIRPRTLWGPTAAGSAPAAVPAC